MKHILQKCIGILVIISLSSTNLDAQIPFNKGINLTGWFQSGSARQIQFTKYTRADFEKIKSLGVDVIRLPINLHYMTSGAPEYELDPIFLTLLDEVVGWSEEIGMNLILDNHTFDPSTDTSPDVGTILVKVWPQLAERYKDKGDFLFYEVLNEPHGISDELWGSIQQTAIDAIRTKDQKHFIIVGASGFNTYNGLTNLPVYTDTKLIYTFHFYDPFVFTHQGASWVTPSMVPLANVPFPYNSTSMPAVPESLKGTWVANALGGYPTEGSVARVKQYLDIAIAFKTARQVPVFCGEFGVYNPNSPAADRVTWYKVVRDYLTDNGIPWTTWDYQGAFGLFTKNSNEIFEHDLNIPLLEALKFTVPVQTPYRKKTRTTGFIIYDDYIGSGISDASSVGTADLDFYSSEANTGVYGIQWKNASLYNSIAFDFKPDLSLSLLPENNFELVMQVKGTTPGKSFDIRFIDTKTATTDRPWRMGKTISDADIPWDGNWHELRIPLSSMTEKGAWDNAWFNPEGKFNWGDVDRLEIVAEAQTLNGLTFAFDDIEVVGTEIENVLALEDPLKNSISIYPNPMQQDLTIQWKVGSVPEEVSFYNGLGQELTTLIPDYKTTSLTIEAGKTFHVPSGLMLVRILESGKYNYFRVVVSPDPN